MRRFLRSLFHLDHVLVTLTTLLLMQLLVWFAFNISFLNPIARALDNFRLTDIFYDIDNSSEQKDTCQSITLIDMTEVFDRARLAEVVDELQALEPAALGIDIVFDGIREDSAGNRRLLESVRNTSVPTFWAYKLTEWREDQGQFSESFHSFFIDSVDVEEGFTNVQRDINGGTVRSFGIQRMAEGITAYSLPAKIAMAVGHDSTSIPRQTDCTICYSATVFPVVPYDSLFDYADYIHGRIVLLGATKDKRDLHYTPIGLRPGLEVLAFTVQTLLEQKIPVEFSFWQTLCITFFLIWLGQVCQHGITRFMVKRKYETLQYIGTSGLASKAASFVLMCLLVGVSFWLFYRLNVYLNTGWAIMGIALLSNARLLYAMLVHILSEHYRWPWLRLSLYK